MKIEVSDEQANIVVTCLRETVVKVRDSIQVLEILSIFEKARQEKKDGEKVVTKG